MKRSKIYKASNVIFNPNTIEAFSYRWWKFVKVIDGLVVFNKYRYSVSTAKHQAKVRQLMIELGIKVDLYVNVRESLIDQTIEELIIQTEENICDDFLYKKLKQGEAYDRKKAKQASLVERVIENTYNQVEVSCG
jgi:hypothetical protein